MKLKSNLLLTTEPAGRRRWLDRGHRVQNRMPICGVAHFPIRTRSVKRRGPPVWRHEYLQAMREAEQAVLRYLKHGETRHATAE